MGRNVRACGKNSGGLGNRAKFWKVLAHSTKSGVGLFLFSPLVLKRQLHFFELLLRFLRGFEVFLRGRKRLVA